VARIGHQGGRAADDPGPELAGHEGQVDDQPDQLAPVAGVDRSVVVAGVAMPGVGLRMPVFMTRVVMGVMIVVVVGHSRSVS
jgi:hypothetical protein